MKNLIIYYSRKGENYVNGQIKNLIKGNTEICAEFIQKSVGGDLFEVETVDSYSNDYNICTKEALNELKNKVHKDLIRYLDNIDEYNNIFICGPCWWNTFPMAIFSLIEGLNFSGKKVTVLMTHEGSGLGNSENDIKRICKGAIFEKGIAIHGADSLKSEAIIARWAKNIVK